MKTDANDILRKHGARALRLAYDAAAPESLDASKSPTEADPALVTDNEFADRDLTDDEEIGRLAKLIPLEYYRERRAVAERLKLGVGALDQIVSRMRHNKRGNAESDPLPFPELAPWPSPVDGARLLDALTEIFSRYVLLPLGAADATALWVLHSHAHDTATISPLLAISSPTPECGKSTLLSLLGALVSRPCPTSNITAAALFRTVEEWQPTLLVDEADTFLGESNELRGIIDCGHSKAGAFVIRTVGEDHKPRRFTTWSPKAIALIGKLRPTLASRSIHIEMRRLAPSERVDPVRADRLDHLQPLARQAQRWASDHEWAIRDADPVMPVALTNRRADNWRHLIAIADVAGGDWPMRARRAAEALTTGDDSQTDGVVLLNDLRAIFTELGVDKISSNDLADMLGRMESRPWAEWRNALPITAPQIAKLLRPFKIHPRDLRFPDGRTGIKGYRLDECGDTFKRYLSG